MRDRDNEEKPDVPDWSDEPGSDQTMDPYVLDRVRREAAEIERLPSVHEL